MKKNNNKQTKMMTYEKKKKNSFDVPLVKFKEQPASSSSIMEYTFINLSTLSISCSGLLSFQRQRSRFHQFLLFRRLKVGQTAHAAFSLIVNLQTVAPDVQLHRFKCFNTEFKKQTNKKTKEKTP